MDRLLNPDTGLMIWTVVTFVLVVTVLGRFAWKPLLAALDAREGRIRDDLKSAENSRLAAEKMRQDYEREMAAVEARTRELIAGAQKEAQRLREEMMKAAQDETAKLSEKTRQQLAEEQRKLIRELRSEVAAISVTAAEKLLRKSVDKSAQEKFVSEAMADFEKWTKESK